MLSLHQMQTNGEGLLLLAGGWEGWEGLYMNEVISLIVLEYGLIAVMHLSVVCPIPPIPGFGAGKEGN